MVDYRDIEEYLNDEYPYTEDVFGLILDLINGVTDVDELEREVKDWIKHERGEE